MRGIHSTGQLTAWLAQRPGVRVVGERTATPPRQPPSEDPLHPVRMLLRHIQELARQHGWVGLEMYNEDGDDRGVHVVLFRDGVALVGEVPLGPLTAGQRRWLERLRATGAAEVHVWSVDDLGAIEACLARPRREGAR